MNCAAPAYRPEKILVVEDNAINLLVARKQLARLGFEIVEALNGREAVDAVAHEHFDLVFMDLHMPEMEAMRLPPRYASASMPARLGYRSSR